MVLQKLAFRCLTVTHMTFITCWGSGASVLIKRQSGTNKEGPVWSADLLQSCQLDICKDGASQKCAAPLGPHLSTRDRDCHVRPDMIYGVQSGLLASIKISGQTFFSRSSVQLVFRAVGLLTVSEHFPTQTSCYSSVCSIMETQRI